MSRVDDLAERLWAARERAEPLAEDPDWLGVDHARALEVADQLFMSPKTVEAHLSRIYRKLGVRTRAELAHKLTRQSG